MNTINYSPKFRRAVNVHIDDTVRAINGQDMTVKSWERNANDFVVMELVDGNGKEWWFTAHVYDSVIVLEREQPFTFWGPRRSERV